MRAASPAPGPARHFSRNWLLLGLLGTTLLVLFIKSFDPHQILFANDGPLGFLKAACNQMPSRFAGTWRDLCWLGGEAPAASPNITMSLLTLFSPVAYLKIYAPFTLLFLGFSAWLFFRQLQLSPMVCALGGVAVGLNGHFFSIACWGLGNWNIAAACAFLAMAAVSSKTISRTWAKALLAGLAVGMGVMEGFDVGAILSVYVGVFILFRAINDDAPIGRKLVNAVVSETVVVLFAALIAAHTMLTLVETQVEGVAAMGQDVQTKETRWNAATQWSLPKLETLQIVAPGFFGYRLAGNITHTNRSGAYWGTIGQDPRIPVLGSDDPKARAGVVSKLNLPDTYLTDLNTADRHSRTAGMQAITKKSGIYWRYAGTGECAGIMITLLALFGLANVWRQDMPYSKAERRAVGFWGLVASFSLVASWGRFAFLYRLLYHLPYFSTIRNPIKFMHPFHIALLVLAAYGMEVLYRRYLRGPVKAAKFLPHHLQLWWSKVAGFDRRWTIFTLVLLGASIAGFFLLYHNMNALIRHLEDQNFAPALAVNISTFCLQHAAAFVVFFAASIVVICAILSGAWSGEPVNWAWAGLAALIIVDLVRADIPWIRYYDYAEEYDLNTVVEFLLDKPYEHRVIGKLEPRGPGSGISQGFGQLYFFWLQNEFPYCNIQSLDFPQAPHMPDLDRLYLKNFELAGSDIKTTDLRPAVRLWQLTNTRYIAAAISAVDLLNQRADPIHRSFRLVSRFDFPMRKPGVAELGDVGDLTVKPNERGQFGIVEYPRALPRAKLFSNWRTPPDAAAVLKTLASEDFEPLDTLLISKGDPLPRPDSASDADPGSVTITGYHPKHVELDADAKAPAVLLLNDRINPDWRVRVDGKPAPLLRCNYIMRGVYLTPGRHTVEFRFKPSLRTLYLSLCAIGAGILLAGYLVITHKPMAASNPSPSAPAAAPPPRTPLPPEPIGNKPNGAAPKRGKDKKAR